MKRLLVVLLIVLSSLYSLAQGGEPGPGGGGDQGNMPIDGGLLYLIAAGISYGLYTLRIKKRS